MVLYMYMYAAPGFGQMSPWGPLFLESLRFSHTVDLLKIFLLNDILTVFPYVDLAIKYHRVMVYKHVVIHESLMLIYISIVVP